MYYPINYGYIEDVIAPDGAGQDVYVLGTEEPLETFDGKTVEIHVETVVVLRDKKVDGHIGIDLDVSKLGIKPER